MVALELTEDEFRELNSIVMARYLRLKEDIEFIEARVIGFDLDALEHYRQDKRSLGVLTEVVNKLSDAAVLLEMADESEEDDIPF